MSRFLTITWLVFLSIFSQSALSADISEPYASHWNIENGLNHNSVYSIAQDHLNRVWAGTPNGVSIIDGLGVINLNKDASNPHAISSNVITKVVPHNQTMWVLSLKGIDIVDTVSLQAKAIADPQHLLARANSLLFIDDTQALVIAHSQLFTIDLLTHNIEPLPELSGRQDLGAMFDLAPNKIIISTLQGFLKLDVVTKLITPWEFETFDRRKEDVRALAIDQYGRLWISVFGKGLFIFEQQKLVKTFNTAAATLHSDMISKLFQHQELFYAVTGKGIEVFDPTSLTRVKTILPQSKGNAFLTADMALTAIFHDDGSLMVGTTHGLFRLPSSNNLFQRFSSLSGVNEFEFLEQTFVQKNDLVVVAGNTAYTITESQQKPTKLGISIHAEKKFHSLNHQGSLQLGEHNQLSIYEGGKFNAININGLPPSTQLSSVHQANTPGNYILIANNQLFLASQTKRQLQVELQRDIGFGNIVDVTVVNDVVFIADQKRGVISIPFNHLGDEDIPFSFIVGPEVPTDLYVDRHNKLWALTFDSGLYYLDSNDGALKFLPLKFSDKASSFQPICMTQDRQDRFWFTTRYGISMLDPVSQSLTSFGEHDGIKPQSFKRFNCGSWANHVYFSSDDNVLMINSADYAVPQSPLELAFNYVNQDKTTFSVDEKHVFIEPSFLSFSLVSPSLNIGDEDKLYYRVQEKVNEYSYEQSQWIVAPSRDITLIKPNTGDYYIEAKILRYNGDESNIASIEFTIAVPFLRSPLMLSIYFLAVLSLISLLYFYKLQLKNSQLKVADIRSEQQQKYSQQLAEEVQQKTEQYKEQQQIAVKANIDKTRFIASASHDLRAPLNAIRWKLENLLEDETQDKKQVMEEIMMLDRLVESIVSLSKFDANIIKPRLSSFSLHGLIAEVVNRFQAYVVEHQVKIEIQLPEQDVFVYSDRFLLARIVNNIVDNALKNMEDAGVLQIQAYLDNDQIIVSLADNGPGIPEHIQSRLFDSFVRGTEKYAGSGLGLTIVNQIAAVLDLELDVQSSEQGTCFSFRLSHKELVQPLSDNGATRTALVIDDDIFYANELTQLLESLAFDVIVINDLQHLSSKGIEGSFDLLVCDFNLGLEVNGIDLVARLKQQFQLTAKQVIVISEDTQVRELVNQQPGYYFLSKPIRKSRLSWLLQQA